MDRTFSGLSPRYIKTSHSLVVFFTNSNARIFVVALGNRPVQVRILNRTISDRLVFCVFPSAIGPVAPNDVLINQAVISRDSIAKAFVVLLACCVPQTDFGVTILTIQNFI